MTQWDIVLVIVALLGLIATVTAPMVKLNSSMTKLTVMLQNVTKELDVQKADNHDSHRRLWEHETLQDKTLQKHENRLNLLEKEKEQ